LKHASGFLQQKVAERIDARYTPKLTFVLDKGVKNSLEVSRILDELTSREDSAVDPASPGEEVAPSDEAAADPEPSGGAAASPDA
jgi:ribosome-binding factor A